MKRWLSNAIGFQLVWVACVAGAARGWWWAGPLALAIFAIVELQGSRAPRIDVTMMAGAAVLGFALDTLWLRYGLLRFATPLPSSLLAPVWIVALWMAFALTLNQSLAGLRPRPVLAAAFGAIGGPLSYAAAERLGAVTLIEPRWTTLAVLAFAWGLLTPLLLRFASAIDDSALEVAH